MLEMSLVEDDRTDGSQTKPPRSETRLHENNSSDPETSKDVKSKDLLKKNPSERRTISPLTLFKEDFGHFKEDFLNVFKDTKTTQEDKKYQNKSSARPLSLLKEDLSQFKEEVTSVFRIALSKERDLRGDTFKIKASRAERSDHSAEIKDETKLLQTAERAASVQGAEEQSKQVDNGLKGNLSVEKVNEEKDSATRAEDGELNVNVPQRTKEKTSFSETHYTSSAQRTTKVELQPEPYEGRDDSSQVAGEDEKVDKKEEEDKSPLPLEALSSGISLLCLGEALKDGMNDQLLRDPWSVKNFACYLTLDPNTANSELHLSDCNRKATRVWSDYRPCSHPDRFERCPQVLCREGLLDSVYWEVTWKGGADIGVSYNNISRNGDTASCLLGHNDRSWSLECSEGCYSPGHNNKRFRSCSPRPFTHRVGVYLNWCAGSLSFYCVSKDSMVHLHTFTTTFTEPLYPCFWVWAYDGSVSLCQVELDWERLLQ